MLGESCDMTWRLLANTKDIEELYSSCTGTVALRVPADKEPLLREYFHKNGFPIVESKDSVLTVRGEEEDSFTMDYVVANEDIDGRSFIVAYKKTYYNKKRWE